MPPERHETQPSAETVRDLSLSVATLCGDRACRAREMQARVRNLSGATLCGDRACRGREMQARVRFDPVRRNPLRRSCVSRARSAGKSAICPGRGQPSAEIVRVECAKCRRECDLVLSGATSAEIARVECMKCRRECDLTRSGATLCGDRACRVREMQARGDSRLFSATLCGDRACRGREMQASVRLGSWKMRTGDFLVNFGTRSIWGAGR